MLTKHRRIVLCLVAIMFLVGPMVNVQADSKPKTILRLQFTSINALVIKPSAFPAVVQFTSHFELQTGRLANGDLRCGDSGPNSQALITQISETLFTARCEFIVDSSTPPGVRIVSLFSYGAPNSDVRIIPSNSFATLKIPEQGPFGEQVSNSYYLSERLDLKSVYYVSAPIVVDPPTGFSPPQFPIELGEYVIFDVRKNKPAILKVSIDRQRKLLLVDCPNSNIPKEMNSIIDPIDRYLVSEKAVLARLSGGKSRFKVSYRDDDLIQGKRMNLSCMYAVRMKGNSIYSGVTLTYVESKPLFVRIPKG